MLPPHCQRSRRRTTMPINPDAVGAQGDPVEVSWDSKDCLLYALGVGAGQTDPTGFELEFTTENSSNITQRALPTQAVVIAMNGMNALSQIGDFNFFMLVHGEQGIELERELPISGTARIQSEVTGIYDKGSGAVVAMQATGVDSKSGDLLFTSRMSAFIRGEGGWGGDRGPSEKITPPDRAPDHAVTYETRHDQALLYRLSGDRNPLHSDPEVAKAVGFEKPILHGLCSYGYTGRALLHALCESDPGRVRRMDARFSKPVIPGDALTVRMWVDGGSAIFQTVNQNGDVVIDNGLFAFA
jgi:acyl dehydratase